MFLDIDEIIFLAEPKVYVIFSDHMLSVVCPSVCQSVRPSVCKLLRILTSVLELLVKVNKT